MTVKSLDDIARDLDGIVGLVKERMETPGASLPADRSALEEIGQEAALAASNIRKMDDILSPIAGLYGDGPEEFKRD